ncbi:hypothetical protein P618_200513 [Holospora obtusa F1]|uniref:Uncharacterized protein n=1 Tax=Holospora obtusa F1 TaxID=1399147 RepID=W6THC7_HOLOB|nr:hypothetical protein P618_200513 [Holospora obtusa F1]
MSVSDARYWLRRVVIKKSSPMCKTSKEKRNTYQEDLKDISS